jgi:hypothetical protein
MPCWTKVWCSCVYKKNGILYSKDAVFRLGYLKLDAYYVGGSGATVGLLHVEGYPVSL